ncbi:hypothetical protein MRX96_052714 [Rhipicephalus microplus]
MFLFPLFFFVLFSRPTSSSVWSSSSRRAPAGPAVGRTVVPHRARPRVDPSPLKVELSDASYESAAERCRSGSPGGGGKDPQSPSGIRDRTGSADGNADSRAGGEQSSTGRDGVRTQRRWFPCVAGTFTANAAGFRLWWPGEDSTASGLKKCP